eukprot:2406065-Rhodomonas_salina.10
MSGPDLANGTGRRKQRSHKVCSPKTKATLAFLGMSLDFGHSIPGTGVAWNVHCPIVFVVFRGTLTKEDWLRDISW